MRRLLALLLVPPALLLTAAGASAAVPSPATSTLPACMALCPFGDIPFTVVVRDAASNPSPGSFVVLDFSQCPGAYLCEGQSFDPYTVDLPTRQLRAFTNAAGSVTFPARVGGTGAPGSVRVYADGVPLRTYALASPDQDGDGFVLEGPPTGSDYTLFTAKLGTSDPTADFDCDGTVAAADQNIFNFHYSQSCLGWVDPVKRSTWGEVKTHYR